MLAAVQASRPPFLVLAPVCVMLGAAVVYAQGLALPTAPLLLALLGGLAAHVSVNTFNEYFDFHSGLDLLTRRTPFSGGSGALPRTPRAAPQVLALAVASMLVAIAVGVVFAYRGSPLIVPVGLAGILLVVFYTKWLNRWPWACLVAPGLGFGLLMVIGTEIALTGRPSSLGLLAAALPFLLTNNLLLLNQFPDIDADRQVGRNHFAIAFGVDRATLAYLASLLLAVALLVSGYISQQIPALGLMALIPLPLALYAWRGARAHGKRIGERPAYLIANVLVSLLSPALLALGLWLGSR